MTGDKLKQLRNGLGLSVSSAAGQVKITPRSWARYESGERKIPQGIVLLFCMVNKVDYDEVVKK
jgi:transcriptional regulator with XRE-family HTH domain